MGLTLGSCQGLLRELGKECFLSLGHHYLLLLRDTLPSHANTPLLSYTGS